MTRSDLCEDGFIVKNQNSTFYTYNLDKISCPNYILTQLMLDLLDNPEEDYTKVKCSCRINFNIKIFNSNEKYRRIRSFVARETGSVFEPMNADLIFQVKAVNEINLNEEFIDATITITLMWTDTRLQWDVERWGVSTIQSSSDRVWIPEIEIINRANDFSPVDERKRRVKISSDGEVKMKRIYRMRSMINTQLSYYPFDVQVWHLLSIQ